MLTWQACVWLVAKPDRHRAAFMAVPGEALGGFLDALRRGRLDTVIAGYLGLPPSGRRLSTTAHAAAPGLYDELGLRSALLAPERDLSGRRLRPTKARHSLPATAGMA
jgi:hypothetical protein